MRSKQYFTKIKNYPHEKSTDPTLRHLRGGRKGGLDFRSKKVHLFRWLFNSLKAGQEKFYYKLFLHKGQYLYLVGSRIKNSDGIPELQYC